MHNQRKTKPELYTSIDFYLQVPRLKNVHTYTPIKFVILNLQKKLKQNIYKTIPNTKKLKAKNKSSIYTIFDFIQPFMSFMLHLDPNK